MVEEDQLPNPFQLTLFVLQFTINELI